MPYSKVPPVRIKGSKVETRGNEAMEYGVPLYSAATMPSFCARSGGHEREKREKEKRVTEERI